MPNNSPLQSLIERTPGHHYFELAWHNEPVNVEVMIFHNSVKPDDNSTYAAELINTVLGAYGPPVESDDPDADGPTLTVPPLVAELLAFWSDEHTFYVDEF